MGGGGEGWGGEECAGELCGGCLDYFEKGERGDEERKGGSAKNA